MICHKTLNNRYCNKTKRFVISSLILSFAIFLQSCASIDKGLMSLTDTISSSDPVTGERQINLIAEKDEIARAEATTKQFLTEARKAGLKIDNETPYFQRVSTIFNRMKNVVHRKHLPWEIHVIEDDAWNAFTIGGGKVFVYTGMFQPKIGVQSDDELAAVLAHEMAHVAARHGSEGQGKLALIKLADKDLRKSQFDASFTTVQEDEADKYSVIYSALSGYDPAAGIKVWQRLHKYGGSYTGDLLYDHPLSDDRARNLKAYSEKAQQYFKPGQINANHMAILESNTIFSYQDQNIPEPGKGGGFIALLDTVASTYKETAKAKTEQSNRKLKQIEQERLAAQYLHFRQLKIGNAQNGGKGLFGTAINATNQEIMQAFVVIDYLSDQTIVMSEKIPFQSMGAHENRTFGLPLKSIQYTSVSIRPVYVQLSNE